ncbi:GNAT family acetyltransferase [Mycena chlorophos]|uniref:GNAT family acetyltransferase n=1 Tax=Mycena chlorophos TaxID=658473 RepID=A0A8H6VZT1_MYCCL|nr:GNAT family acetyltransferase [Mycena chlorophos]
MFKFGDLRPFGDDECCAKNQPETLLTASHDMGAAKLEYIVRPYRPSDLPQLRDLLYEGYVTSKGSVADLGVRRAWRQPPCIVGYAQILTGAALIFASRNAANSSLFSKSRAGLALVGLGAALIVTVRRLIRRLVRDFCDNALKTDMVDIESWYWRAGGGFWVAVRPRPGAESEEEVLGCVGLEFRPLDTTPPASVHNPCSTAQIRRMIVSAAHRRKGIALQVMQAALAHADANPEIEYVHLGTTDLQPAAQALYDRMGFERFGERVIGNWAGTTVERHYKRMRPGQIEALCIKK